MKEVVEALTKAKKTIATMESCTGGCVVNEITNIEGSSEVLRFSAVTYSNEYKIKMGVPKEVIDQYSVYSSNTADAMAKTISEFTDSDYGVGITGKLCRSDNYNLVGEDNIVYVSIYDKEKKALYRRKITVEKRTRSENKQVVVQNVKEMLLSHLPPKIEL